ALARAVAGPGAAQPSTGWLAGGETPPEIALPAARPAAAAPEAVAAEPLAPACDAAEAPSLAMKNFLTTTSGPTGYTAARARFARRSSLRNTRQRSQPLRWRRTGAVVLAMPSAT